MTPPTDTRRLRLLGGAVLAAALSACGGSNDANNSEAQLGDGTDGRRVAAAAGNMTQAEAVRLAHQATFGPSEALVAELRRSGRADWVQAQMALPASRYTAGSDLPMQSPKYMDYCGNGMQKGNPNCWRDNYSLDPLLWDFYRNASFQPDQLRQRVAFALQQIIVVNDSQTIGTYAFKHHYNQLTDLAFGNYRDVLRQMTLSPVMGKFLNNVNNNRAAPNENFARELLQLFSLGPCQLNANGSLAGGACKPTYDNTTVREYAYALTGWTYPVGGIVGWQCGGTWPNCEAYGSDMVPFTPYHDTNRRQLLGGISVPANSTPDSALERVLDSLMAHPNIAPFIAKRLIEKLVMSNPPGAYVQRVSSAFQSGSYSADGLTFGRGQKGDLAATVAAVLLDNVARAPTPQGVNAGHLREPQLMMVGALRAMNGGTDGQMIRWGWDTQLQQQVFRAPSVFNFYPPEFAVPGTDVKGPEFGIHGTNPALVRLNFLNAVLIRGTGYIGKDESIPGSVGTYVRRSDFYDGAADGAALVDRLSNLVIGEPLPEPARSQVIAAVEVYKPGVHQQWQDLRVATASYLVLASPDYQVQR